MYERNGILVQKKFNEYLLSTIMTSLAMSLASVVDSIIVGNLLGNMALAAIGLAGPVIFCINMIYMLFGVGGVTCASVAKGRRNSRQANQIFTLTMVLGIGAMFLFLIMMYIFMKPITNSFAAGDVKLAAMIADYLRPLLFTGPGLMFASGLALFIRMDGQPQSAALVVVIANIVNLVLDFVLIRFLNAGIMGAGLSTSLGYVFGALIVIPYLLNKNRSFHFLLPKKEEIKIIAEILRTGLPKALTQLTSFFRSIVLNSLVMFSLGSIGMSVMTVCINVLMIAGIFVGGISDALLPIAGTMFGEHDYYGIRQTLKSACRVLGISCFVLLAFFMITPQTIGVFFALTSEEGMAVLIPALRLFALYIPFYGINTVLQNFYTTTGRSKLASSIATMDGFIFVVCYAGVFALIGGNILWLCYACSGATTLFVVLLIGQKIKKREQVSSILLLREEAGQSTVMDVTINATAQEAAGLSGQIIDFCIQNGIDSITANRLGVAVEEMAMNTVHMAHDKKSPGVIDILVRVTEDELIMRFRDDGEVFDLTSYQAAGEGICVTDGIEVIKKLANGIDYIRQLGFNTTVITFQRN